MLAEDVEEKSLAPPMWTSEPKTIEALLDAYIVEQKISAKQPGLSLFLTTASRRDGEKKEIVSGQCYKLWLALCFNSRWTCACNTYLYII